jgi:hypothetical protein
MARKKLYANHAQRQQAYRQRLKVQMTGLTPVVVLPRPLKRTRPKRLEAVIKELEGLSQEYEHWLEALPENLAESEQACQLQATIEQLQEVVSLLDAVDR